MKSHEIRQRFITFFQSKQHQHVPSSSLIPANDPTLLFANAGMNQFKEIFLGQETRPYTRAITVQKCMRAGGKHNDLENVGRTTRHLTFFEMLGNFSFGDYFKKDAITYAWEFLTKELQLPKERLWVTVYFEDEEAFQIWHKDIGLPSDRITRLGRKDNFWQMGDTGPCGPCSEIYVDKGAKTPEEEQFRPGDDCERFLEVWNLVFMQFNRDENGTETPLKKTGIDTGMGLERICSILQNVESAFDTDIFSPLFATIEQLSGITYNTATPEQKIAFRVLSDHIRSTALVIADGCMPSNEGRGYVIRKIIRRAALFAQKLGSSRFFAQLAPNFIAAYQSLYPELAANKNLIEQTLSDEIEKFESNLQQGLTIFNSFKEKGETTISGEQAFKLYDTYGFPLELTLVLAQDAGYTVDTIGFEKAMEEQRQKSGKKTKGQELVALPQDLPATTFVGYTQDSVETPILKIVTEDGQECQSLTTGQKGHIITAESPCYVESGGQTSDQGVVIHNNTTSPIVLLTKQNSSIIHTVEAKTTLHVGDVIRIQIDTTVRAATKKNHTATHLLQSALMRVLGGHIKQAGSFVSDALLRFDFTHTGTPTAEELATVENLVNTAIQQILPVVCTTCSYEEAKGKGALAFFGEKYNPTAVRMISVQNVSTELCGGTHVGNTGEIGIFKIVDCSALSAGIKRITAVTGLTALEILRQSYNSITEASQLLKTPHDQVLPVIKEKLNALKITEKELQKTIFAFELAKLEQAAAQISKTGTPIFISEIQDVRLHKELKNLVQSASKTKTGLMFVFAKNETSILFAADIQKPNKAQEAQLMNKLASWLSETYNLRAHVQNTTLIGGGNLKLTNDVMTALRTWILENI